MILLSTTKGDNNMSDFTETQVQRMLDELKDEFGSEIATRELALLELEDLKRKGCVLEYASKFDRCRECPVSDRCPVLNWEQRHPEYKDDELAMKIKVLEAGGEEAFKAKLEAQKKASTKHTYIDKQVMATGNGDLSMWRICAVDDSSVLAETAIQYLAEVIQKAIEEDIEKHESICWQE